MGHLCVQLRHQVLQPVHGVENLDALRVRIVPDFERSAHSGNLKRRTREINNGAIAKFRYVTCNLTQ